MSTLTSPATYQQPEIDATLAVIKFDAQGLVPAIAQQHDTGEVLMMAWMDRDAVAETMRTGRAATGRARARRRGARATHRATSRRWSTCASIATATRCWRWSTRPAWPATPAGTTASSAPIRDGALAEIAPIEIDMEKEKA